MRFNSFAVNAYIGNIGILSGLIFFFLCFVVIELGWTPRKNRYLVEENYRKKRRAIENQLRKAFRCSQLSRNKSIG
jgi:hypothetical protein